MTWTLVGFGGVAVVLAWVVREVAGLTRALAALPGEVAFRALNRRVANLDADLETLKAWRAKEQIRGWDPRPVIATGTTADGPTTRIVFDGARPPAKKAPKGRKKAP